ncbi:MarR family transcriptional regulator [Streptomyces sp. DSM 44917]|uniref:MarR family transcriptional regulator n=1 Tax=Streptomyces boetiae TaxID=3075541 RepID=A0ABU2L348_9ACTN|nr:MarR family transcriptional regulator [Streptomyces sp. DSM 44917]MDT0305831.1 MarR family transcriptional regulator [Streptomyces sp. DSM 44917]
MTDTPDRPVEELVALLTRAERLSVRRLRAALEEAGCSADAWRVMALLADGRGHGMTAMAEHVVLPPPTLTRLVDQLTDDGVVHRTVDPLDRRRILVHLTPRGRQLWQRLDQRVRGAWPELPGGGDEELLAALLRRLVAALEGAPATAPSRGANGR